MVNFLEHAAAGMDQQVAQAIGKPGIDDQILFLQSETAAYGGELAKSREAIFLLCCSLGNFCTRVA
jgi:hypothetical protein